MSFNKNTLRQHEFSIPILWTPDFACPLQEKTSPVFLAHQADFCVPFKQMESHKAMLRLQSIASHQRGAGVSALSWKGSSTVLACNQPGLNSNCWRTQIRQPSWAR